VPCGHPGKFPPTNADRNPFPRVLELHNAGALTMIAVDGLALKAQDKAIPIAAAFIAERGREMADEAYSVSANRRFLDARWHGGWHIAQRIEGSGVIGHARRDDILQALNGKYDVFVRMALATMDDHVRHGLDQTQEHGLAHLFTKFQPLRDVTNPLLDSLELRQVSAQAQLEFPTGDRHARDREKD
jgi:hypothetical protein